MRSLVIGASGGIGGALVQALRARGGRVSGLSRSGDGFDVTDEASVERGLAALDGPFDLVFIATGGLVIGDQRPEKSLSALDPAALAAQFALNAIGPAIVLKHLRRLLPRDRPAHVAVLSARVGSIGDNALGGWYGYRAAKAALNQLVHTAAVELTRTHPQLTLIALHPGTVATSLGPAYRAGHAAQDPDEAAGHLIAVLAQRTPADSGGFFDWQAARVVW